MNRIAFYNMLNSLFTEEVFPDYVPEGEGYPCITYSHINNNRASRNIGGGLSGKSDTWRVEVYGVDRLDCTRLINILETLDNTSNADFQSVTIINIADERDSPELEFSRSFIDIETYDK